jgi:hypothetical protein
MASASSITLDTAYVLDKLENKLALAKKSYAQYKRDMEKFEETREARESKLKKQILKSLTVDDISFSSHTKYDHTSRESYDYVIYPVLDNRKEKHIFKVEDLPEFVTPKCEFNEHSIKEMERMVEVLKACATATFNSKILGSVQDYL